MNHVNSQSGKPQSSSPESPLLGASQSTTMAGSIRRLKEGRSTVSENLPSEEDCRSTSPSVEQFQKLPDEREIPHKARHADSGTYSSSSPGNLYTPAIKDAERPDVKRPLVHQPTRKLTADVDPQKVNGSFKSLFRPLEDYIITSFSSLECINSSFSTIRPSLVPRAKSEGAKRWLPTAFKAQPKETISAEKPSEADSLLSELDAKTLLLGDFAENGSWWTGGRSEEKTSTRNDFGIQDVDSLTKSGHLVNLKSPHIDWPAVNEWYSTVVNAGNLWRARLHDLNLSTNDDKDGTHGSPSLDFIDIESRILEAQTHTQRVLLKATESLLKRPGRPMNKPEDVRFLLIILANPLLYPSHVSSKTREENQSRSPTKNNRAGILLEVHQLSRSTTQSTSAESRNTRKGSSGQHSGIIKRILGLLANAPNECHHHLVSWFARFTDSHFQKTVDLVGSFVTYRLTRQHGKQRGPEKDQANHLIPSISGTGRGSSAALHAALGVSSPLSSKKSTGKTQPVIYDDDWQIKAAAKVMALLFSANNYGQARKGETRSISSFPPSTAALSRDRNLSHGQIIATSDFYNTLLDYSDLIADFEAWEAKRGKFSFCQYPFFLSIWAKIQIMEHDARRQMEVKAREAFFDSIMTRQVVNQYLVLKIRRECLVEDSLKGVSEVVGSGSEEIKKGLRIEFKGEEGIDAGGLRKEWFLLLVRDVFNPEHGMPPSQSLSGRLLTNIQECLHTMKTHNFVTSTLIASKQRINSFLLGLY
jgi:E3 ubiquitin-protein ligase HECTD2